MFYNRSIIVSRAWDIKKKREVSWGEALHRAWGCAKAEVINSERIIRASREAGIPRQMFVFTWSQWRDLGYEVIHGSKARFKVDLIQASHGDGATYRASFFDSTQVRLAQ